MTNSNRDEIEQIIETLRKRLLDLTSRNRLINFKHNKSCLRIIDELPDQLTEKLLADQEMYFTPIPNPSDKDLNENNPSENELEGTPKMPTAEEWAIHLGLSTDYEMPTPSIAEPEEKHTDTKIQTLLYPYELENRLKNILQKGELAIREMGTNILYLAFGFLEWFDNDNENSCIAPLFLVPANLQKGKLEARTKTYQYTLKYSGEDIIPNLSLKEKLLSDFGMALPDLDENTTPEEYFEEVQVIIRENKNKYPKWRLRRYITLALLDFRKLLMYLDLDPSRWPQKASIIEHSVVTQLISSHNVEQDQLDNQNDHIGFSGEYRIDEVDNIHANYPLIYDADSSQHSALIDAVDGKNLVIEGPPGTGKSQTITNLIAAAMARGKRVLFVAEKLAALEVVYRRLETAGLGEFCLELHSHKSQKRKVMDDISDRLKKPKGYHKRKDIDVNIQLYEERKKALNEYVEKINSPWKKTQKTIHEILTAATRYRNVIKIHPVDLHPKGYNGVNFDPMTQQRVKDQVQIFRDAYQEVIKQLDQNLELQSHPWYGVCNAKLKIFDLDRVKTMLEAWQNSLKNLNIEKIRLAENINCAQENIPDSLANISLLLTDLENLPKLNGDELLDKLPVLRGQVIKQTKEYIELFEDIQTRYITLDSKVEQGALQDLQAADDLQTGTNKLHQLVNHTVELSVLSEAIQKLIDMQNQLDQWRRPLEKIHTAVDEHTANHLLATEAGLSELITFINLVADLSPLHWKMRDNIFDNDELDELLPTLSGELEKLRSLHEELEKVFKLHTLPSRDELLQLRETLAAGGSLAWFKGSWRTARKKVLHHAIHRKIKILVLQSLLGKAADFIEQRSQIDNNRQYQEALGSHLRGLDTDLAALQSLRDWYKKIRSEYGIGFGTRVCIGDAIISFPTELAKNVRSLAEQKEPKKLCSLLENLAKLKDIFTPATQLHENNALLVGPEGTLASLIASLKDALRACKPLATNNTISVAELISRSELLNTLKNKVGEWTKADIDNKLFQGQLGLILGLNIDNTSSLSIIHQTLAVATFIDQKLTHEKIKQYIYDRPERSTFNTLETLSKQLRIAVDTQVHKYNAFAKELQLDANGWMRNSGDKIETLISRNNQALGNDDTLQNWIDYVRERDRITQMGFTRLAESIECGDIDIHRVEDACYAAIFDCLAHEILQEEPQLERFSGTRQKSFQDQFKEYDNKLKELQSKKIAWKIDQTKIPQGNRGIRVAEYTEKVLLEHEINKKTRHIPIRQLLDRASGALIALKPCFMMGPMSVAQYLKPGKIEFDLVVMDEASQIKPEDALGAVARGTQLVVVGDPKQLPPTNFFNRLTDDDDEDPAAIQEAEGILDSALSTFSTRRRLRWHYRSQHETLIAFSNQSFYDSDLVLFPSSYSVSDGYGIEYIPVPHGCFIDRRNLAEAEIISQAVREHFKNLPNESIGVVAMNAEQRFQIETAIETLTKEDIQFRNLFEKNSDTDEPLFVKNLENVQGDERDAIIISMTYGPKDPNGKIYQRFGPINSQHGWRRLNVLFTRAKKRMRIFSSMSSNDIITSPTLGRGVQALRDFLSYCETGILHRSARETGRPPDSDFEIAVMNELSAAGFQCKPQVGVDGFFIDVAVVDPSNPGRFLMGIECDGATYHSAKSTRDRDRLRQDQLERLGWTIRRIWSTDWYRNSRAQINPILHELREMTL